MGKRFAHQQDLKLRGVEGLIVYQSLFGRVAHDGVGEVSGEVAHGIDGGFDFHRVGSFLDLFQCFVLGFDFFDLFRRYILIHSVPDFVDSLEDGTL